MTSHHMDCVAWKEQMEGRISSQFGLAYHVEAWNPLFKTWCKDLTKSPTVPVQRLPIFLLIRDVCNSHD